MPGPYPINHESPEPNSASPLCMTKLLLASMVMTASMFGASSVHEFTLNSIDGKPAPLSAYQGKVVLNVEIGPDGAPHNIRVTQGLGFGLDENAVDALSQWKFAPGTKNGVAVTVAATIEVNFRLL